MERAELGTRVRIKADAEDRGHLFQMRFKAFRDMRYAGHIRSLEDEDQDPHPVEVDFAENPYNPETMWLAWDELELVPDDPARETVAR